MKFRIREVLFDNERSRFYPEAKSYDLDVENGNSTWFSVGNLYGCLTYSEASEEVQNYAKEILANNTFVNVKIIGEYNHPVNSLFFENSHTRIENISHKDLLPLTSTRVAVDVIDPKTENK
jgi:hypothetical protein